MFFDIEKDIKKLYKQRKTKEEIIIYLVSKYSKQMIIDKAIDVNIKIDLLKSKKYEIKNSKFMNSDNIDIYYFGFLVVVVVSGMLFYEMPILIGIDSIVYGISIPIVICYSKTAKGRNIKKELEILYRLKYYLDDVVNNDEGLQLVKQKNMT